MKRCKYSMVIIGGFLLSMGIMACSSATVSETKAEASEATQTQEDLAGTSETQESSAALETEEELKGFDLPESAIAAYLAGLKDNDLNYMLDTFGGGSYADYYSLHKASEIAQTALSPQDIEVSVAYDFSRNIFIENRNNEIGDDILRQYAVLFQMNTEPYGDTGFREDGNAKKLLDQISNQIKAVDFSSLKLLGFIPPEKLLDVYGSENHQKNMLRMARDFGADKLESHVAAIELGDNKYLFFLM